MLEFSQEFLKLECLNLVYTWTMSCCIILPFICPFFFYPVFFVFVFRLFRIRVTVFFATYLLLLLYSSALLKQCSGAIVRFSDSSSQYRNRMHSITLIPFEIISQNFVEI